MNWEQMNKIRVLVADDHPAFRECLTRLIKEEYDLEVIAMAGNGLQAVESTTVCSRTLQ